MITIGKQYLGYTLGDQNNSVLYTIGDNLTGDTEATQIQAYQQTGFCSIPPNPIPGSNSTELITVTDATNREVAVGTRYINIQGLYANMAPGDAMMYGPGPNGIGPARVKCNGADASITLMTTDDGTVNGNMVALRLSPAGLSFISPWFNFTIDKTGGHFVQVDGGSLHMTPTQDPTTGGSAIMISGGTVTINSGSINLGPQTGVYLPAAVSVLPVAVPGVPLTGEGVGAVVLNLVASPVVNISGVAS